MNIRKRLPGLVITQSLLPNALGLPALSVVDDFESGLPAGVDGNGIAIGFNTFQAPNPAVGDVIVAEAGIGPLADNGGPTLSPALRAGSPALDTAADAACPAVDQRGVTRPQGAHCDIGSLEQTP